MFNFFKKINSASQTITSAAIIIGALSLASRLVGIFRDRILASQFGAGNMLDVYYAAFRLPDFVYNLLILGAVSAGLIPIFTGLLAKHQEDEAWRLISSILNILSVGLFILCAILFIFAPQIIPLFTPGFPAAKMGLVIVLSRIMFLSPLLLGLSAIFSSVLQSFKKFFVYSLAPIFYNIGIIVGALFFVKWWGIYGLAWGVVLGAFIHMFVQFLPLFNTGFKYRFIWGWSDKNVRQVIKMTIPRTMALLVSQFNDLAVTFIASTMVAGSLAIFTFSDNLQNFPTGVFGISMAVAALPVLSEQWAKKERGNFVSTISQSFRQILFLIIPASAFLFVLRAQIVRIILGAGRFTWYDTRLTAACLAVFCLGLFAQCTFPLIIRGFYALHNTKTPFFISLAAMIVNLASLFFFRWLFTVSKTLISVSAWILHLNDLQGIADFRVLALPLATSVSAIFELFVLMVFMRRIIGRLDGRKILFSLVKIFLAALGGGALAYGVLQGMAMLVPTEKVYGLFIQGLLAGLMGIIGYWLIGTLLRMEEMSIFIASFRRKLFRNVKVVPITDDLGNGEAS